MATPLVSSSFLVATDRDASRPSLFDEMHTSLTHAHLPRNSRRLSDPGLRFNATRPNTSAQPHIALHRRKRRYIYHLCARNSWSTTLNLHLFACANNERITALSPSLPPPTHPQSPFQASYAPAPRPTRATRQLHGSPLSSHLRQSGSRGLSIEAQVRRAPTRKAPRPSYPRSRHISTVPRCQSRDSRGRRDNLRIHTPGRPQTDGRCK